MDNNEVKQEVAAIESESRTFAARHRNLLIAILVALAMAAGGFLTGRYTTAAKVVEKEKIVTQVQTVTKVEYKDRIVTQKVYVTTEKKHEHTTETTTKKPDGTMVTQKETTTDEDDSKNAEVSTDDTKSKDTATNQTMNQTVTKEKITLQQPDWSIYAGAALDIPYFLGQGQHGVPGMAGVVVQAGVDRRVIGPFWMGLYGNTEGHVGLNLRAAW